VLKLLNFSLDSFKILDDLSKEMNVIISYENEKCALDYFEIARNDFKAFKKLYKSDPALGVYHLEQFHEKLINSFLLLSGRAESKDLDNHNRALLKINSLIKTVSFNKYLAIYKDLINNEFEFDINIIFNEKKISINPNEKEISSLLLFLTEIRKKYSDKIFILKFIKNNTKGHKLTLIQKLLMNFNFQLKKKEIKQIFSEELVSKILFFNYLNYSIILLYVLFLPHYSRSRYIKGDINYFEYKKMDLTKKLDEIKIYNEILIKDYNRFIKNKIII